MEPDILEASLPQTDFDVYLQEMKSTLDLCVE